LKRLFYIIATFLSLFLGQNIFTNININKMDLVYSHLVKENKDEFIRKVKTVSSRLAIDPNWLMATMFLESTLNPKAVNPVSGATGLIQFMPNTAAALGTNTEAIKNMPGIDQLDLVYKYLLPYRGRMQSFTDTYLAVFFPVAIGKPDEFILQTPKLSAQLIARQNPAYDLNRNGIITKKEVEDAIMVKMRPEYLPTLTAKKKTI
jgi:hypothetical protein